MVWLIPLIGLAVGIGLGVYSDVMIPLAYSQYIAIALLSAIDAIFGGYLGALEKKFDAVILLSGFFFNAIFGIVFTYIGIRLGVEIYLAVVFVFVYRIFANFGTIRRLLIQQHRYKKRKKSPDKKGGNRIEE